MEVKFEEYGVRRTEVREIDGLRINFGRLQDRHYCAWRDEDPTFFFAKDKISDLDEAVQRRIESFKTTDLSSSEAPQ